MVLGGISITATYGKEQTEVVYADEEESLILSETYLEIYLGDDDIEITVTPNNFTPTEYTWTSSDESIATVSGTGSTATIHPVGWGSTNITVSAQGTNGVVESNSCLIRVNELDVDLQDDDIKMQPCYETSVELHVLEAVGDVTIESVSLNPDVAYLDSFSGYGIDYCLIIKSGFASDDSTTITITVKDMGGASGCHTKDCTIKVSTSSFYYAGDKIQSSHDLNEDTAFILANNSKTRFAYIDFSESQLQLKITNDVRKASLFVLNGRGKLVYYFYQNRLYEGYVYYRGIINVSYEFGNSSTKFNFYDSEDENLCGRLVVDRQGACLGILNDTVGGISLAPQTNYEYLYTFSVVNAYPGIAPNEDRVRLEEGESTDIDATAELVEGITCEIYSGAQYIEEATVSEIDNQNHFNIHIKAASDCGTGTAVIRVKDVNNSQLYREIIVKVKSHTVATIGNISTQANLSYAYSKNEEQIELSDVAIRFGGQISKTLWNELNGGENGTNIIGYGVMIAKYSDIPVTVDSIEEMYEAREESYGSFENSIEVYSNATYLSYSLIKVFYNEISTLPAEQGDYYFWNLYKQINNNDIGLARQYTAVAYIRTANDGLVFLSETTKSAARLARELNTANPELDATLDGSLSHLANLDQEN